MIKALLVGERKTLLEILSVALCRKGATTCLAHESGELRDGLSRQEPNVVIFDHSSPLDLFDLNPRMLGFQGPILLLTDEPTQLGQDILATGHVMRKPFSLKAILEEIDELVLNLDGE